VTECKRDIKAHAISAVEGFEAMLVKLRGADNSTLMPVDCIYATEDGHCRDSRRQHYSRTCCDSIGFGNPCSIRTPMDGRAFGDRPRASEGPDIPADLEDAIIAFAKLPKDERDPKREAELDARLKLNREKQGWSDA